MALKTIVLGFGTVADTLGLDARMARYFPKGTHAAVLAEHPCFDWAGVVDPAEAARHRARNVWGVRDVAADLADVPAPESFECAVIATRPDHREGILERLPNLRAVMLEKPVATSLGAAVNFADACRRRNIAVQVNYWRRGVPGFRALASGGLIDLIGEPRAIFGVYGGGLYNTGSHLVDFIRFLAGDIATAEPASDVRPAPDGRLAGDVAASVSLRLASGVPARLLPIDFRDYREASLDVWGTTGRLAVEQESLVTRLFPRTENRGLVDAREVASDSPRTLDIPVAEAFIGLYDNLAQAVSVGDPLVSPLESALETEWLLDVIAAAAAGTQAGNPETRCRRST